MYLMHVIYANLNVAGLIWCQQSTGTSQNPLIFLEMTVFLFFFILLL